MNDSQTTTATPRRNNRKLIIGAAALLGAVGLIGAGAFAAFTDTETTGVTADAGQLDITGADDISFTDIAPGDVAIRSLKITLPPDTNDGDLVRAIRLSVPRPSVDTPGTPADTGDANTPTTVAGQSLLSGANGLRVTLATCSVAWTLPRSGAARADADRNGIDDAATCGGTVTTTQSEVALSELATAREYDAARFGVAATPTGTIPDGTTLNLIAQFRLPDEADNSYENAALTFDVVAEAVQRAGVNR